MDGLDESFKPLSTLGRACFLVSAGGKGGRVGDVSDGMDNTAFEWLLEQMHSRLESVGWVGDAG